jgi:hypothetical protein
VVLLQPVACMAAALGRPEPDLMSGSDPTEL